LLRPETPPEGMPARRIVPPEAPPTPLEERGERLGLKFRRGRQTTSYSHLALEAAEHAFAAGADERGFHSRLFKAYFEDLEDIGDVETLVRIGAEAGLDGDELRKALTDRRYQARVDEGITWSRALGVTAIPTFVFDERYAMVGAQELETFRQMMAKLGRAPREGSPK
jgi:predicted DsbA family dithiol-disulfide isomerase